MSKTDAARDSIVMVANRFTRFATLARIVLDVAAWSAATAAAIYLRFNLQFDEQTKSGLIRVLPVAAALQIVFGAATGLYRRRWLYGSFDEVAALVLTAAASSASLYLLNEFYFRNRPIPQSAVIFGGVVGLMLMAGVRYLWRLIMESARRPDIRTSQPMLVYGAGEGGRQAIVSMMRSRVSPYRPVGLLDDDPMRHRLSIAGVPALGGRADLKRAVAKTGATALLLAIPSADAKTMRELANLAQAENLDVKVLPPVDELLDRPFAESDIRDLSEEDLLGRHRVNTDVEQIAGYLKGKRVLVTGAGGSIGSELCRQLHTFSPAELIMLDRDESALHQVQLSIHGRALLDGKDTVLADIRDRDRIHDIFQRRRPDVVFHAAALKHLPLLESYPDEGYKTNVLGSRNVLDAALASGVTTFVNVSTDKAADPTSVLGYSKRVAERLTSQSALSAEGSFLSVRFGNVLGSRGSVLTTFREQIAHGGPVTVTDRNVTRFFMTVREAVELVIQAGAIGRPGEVLILDMGEPVRIDDVARRLIAQSKSSIQIVYTGLRPGEKLEEDLFGPGEVDVRPRHELISHAVVPPLGAELPTTPPADSRALMIRCCELTTDFDLATS